MEITDKTHEIFIIAKCGLVSMTGDKHIYVCSNGDLIFFYPALNVLRLHKVTERDTEHNMPIVNTKTFESEWKVNNNEDVEMALEMITGNIKD